MEPRVVDGCRNAGSQQPQKRRIVFAERVEARRLNIDDSDEFAASEHRNRQFRSHSIKRGKIARIALHIVHDYGVA